MATPATDKKAPNDLRIRLSDQAHIESWADRLGVGEDELRRAIQRAGTWAPAVEKLLTGSSSLRPSTRSADESWRAAAR